jgi:hypothetical protein
MDDTYATPWADENGVSMDQEPLDDGVPFGGADPTADSGKTGKKQSLAFKGGFFQMPRTAYRCDQYAELGMASKVVLYHLLDKYAGNNNGQIGASTRKIADECRINRETAGRALKELQEAGFLDRVKDASLCGREWLSPEWRLTFLRCDVTGQPPSNRFLRIKPAAARRESRAA